MGTLEFKNESKIESVDTSESSIRSKRGNDQITNASEVYKEYIEYSNWANKHPVKYAESLHGYKLTLWQKIDLLFAVFKENIENRNTYVKLTKRFFK